MVGKVEAASVLASKKENINASTHAFLAAAVFDQR